MFLTYERRRSGINFIRLNAVCNFYAFRSLKASVRHSLASRKLNGSSTDEEDSLAAKFKILNLVPENASKEGANGTGKF